ncbi:hypothetical protein T2_00014 [Ralstonia phage Elie]|uniref:Uncharacterized protein n=4 Tax=Bakolyvirus TaxID=2843355 RepID=A0A7G5BBP3_9CAUD|nr:hypothetical protein KE332_gp14 [Ralstonia phage Adzire]YP_010052793.1 hypothetical protein KE333_gp44 [Ralstonia phage Bakoly]YP_010077701.1 hypothetical protein KMC38_gp14 [Ralstonia phage Simangalove]QMV32959.1 hypothetical protein T2_00014 [Ralstonia phage Elie]QMV33526.1 hypothetical protein 30B_00019 [Ralstonia phage Jenny]QMV33671.1 hypothetical protein S3_00027 [Ralstonia phage Sarlave]QMV32331.1 hypothetical protein S1_00014 [Ralstonia phage Adzire]QMV32617.1 hypothetical protein
MSFLLALIPAPIRGAVEGALLFALAASIACGAVYLHHSGYKAGAASVQSQWGAQKLADANAYAQALAKADAQNRQQQAQWEQKLAAASTQYQEALRNVETKHTAALAALRAGTLRLRDPGAGAGQDGSGAVPNPATGASRRDGSAPGELSGPSSGVLSGNASEFILGLAAEADEVAERLGACQAVVQADRAVLQSSPTPTATSDKPD